jgi:hypothetical protein
LPSRATSESIVVMRATIGGVLLFTLLAIGRVAGAQSAVAGVGETPRTCDERRPSYDFRRVTSDSERVRTLSGAPDGLARRVGARGLPVRVPRDRQDYDIVLDVPRLCIEHLELRVDSLRARVSLEADIADMVRVTAGAGVTLGQVDLRLSRVRATALLAVDLSYVVRVVDETMSYLEAHPEILARVLEDRIRRERRARSP